MQLHIYAWPPAHTSDVSPTETHIQSSLTAGHLTHTRFKIIWSRLCVPLSLNGDFNFVSVCVCVYASFWGMKESSVSCAAQRDHRLALSLPSFSFLFSFSPISLSLEAWSALWPYTILPHPPPDPLPLTFRTKAVFLNFQTCLSDHSKQQIDYKVCFMLFLLFFCFWSKKNI